MSRSGDLPPAPPGGSVTAESTPTRSSLREHAEREVRDFLDTHATLSAIEQLQRVRDVLADAEPASEWALQQARAAAFSAAFYDGAASLWSPLQITRPSWLMLRRRALAVEGAWLNSASAEDLAQRARSQGIAHDPSALTRLPELTAESIPLEEKVRAFRKLRQQLVRQVYRANPATSVNPTGLSQAQVAEWSGLTQMRISQLISSTYRRKSPAGEVD